jgi:hypothetical protein
MAVLGVTVLLGGCSLDPVEAELFTGIFWSMVFTASG